MASFGFDAFLSYTTEDLDFARKLVNWLRASGFEIWFAEEQLIPGQRWREGLENGLEASRHLVALLTKSYSNRRWTQRELDLFDLEADQTRRRMLGIQIGEIERGTVDQVFLVDQRLYWKDEDFDPEAFWKLYCGLKGEKPGPQSGWAGKGHQLISARVETREKVTVAEVQAPRSRQSTQNPASDLIVVERSRTKKSLAAKSLNSEWASIGPTNIGGKTTALVCHPTKPETIWLGTVGGGVWMSEDGGKSWRSLWHAQDSLFVGALAVDQRNPDIIYCGTGVADYPLEPFSGVGFYKTENGGTTWKLTAGVKSGLPKYTASIAVDPFDSKHILLGGAGYYKQSQPDKQDGGIYVSLDAGLSWTRETFVSKGNYSCHSIVFDPANEGVIFAALVAEERRAGIWRSKNGGKSWTQLTKGLPSPTRIARTTLAISPSNTKIVYAVIADGTRDHSEPLLGIFRSTNAGNSWKKISGNHFAKDDYFCYANCLVVHPKDPKFVICGGLDLHLTRNGGGTWRKISRWDSNRGDPDYAHAYHHALLMPAAAPGVVYDANDGGLDVSEDGGRHWVNRSNGLAITEFYQIDVAPSDARCYGGGTDKNGVVLTTTGRPDDHFELLGGEGGRLIFDPKNPQHIFASYYNLNIYRFRGRRSTDVSPLATEEEKNLIWLAAIAIHPENPKIIFAGSQRVWKTRNDGNTWTAVSKEFDGSNISALEVPRADPNRVYAGTEKGGIFLSLDQGGSWTQDIVGPLFPRRAITSLKSSASNADIIFASVAGFGHSHIFRSDDGGENWTDIDKGRLPDVPHHAIALADDDPKSVYVCCEVGVFFSSDVGGRWQNITGKLPNTVMVDLVYHQKEGALYVATIGRSIWRIQIR